MSDHFDKRRKLNMIKPGIVMLGINFFADSMRRNCQSAQLEYRFDHRLRALRVSDARADHPSAH